MRVPQERALKALTQQLGEEQHGQRERKMQTKYKMVKFMGMILSKLLATAA
jgi:hypothetical protein